MNDKHRGAIRRINHLATELDALYHLSSLRLGISDSVSVVLYALQDAGGACLLSEICKQSGISKQTVNSALRGLETDGLAYLEPVNGRAKKVILTEKGRAYAQKTAARLLQAEADALDTWTEEEIQTYVRLMEKYAGSLRREIEKW